MNRRESQVRNIVGSRMVSLLPRREWNYEAYEKGILRLHECAGLDDPISEEQSISSRVRMHALYLHRECIATRL